MFVVFLLTCNKLTKLATNGAITPPTRAPIEHAEKAMFLENQKTDSRLGPLLLTRINFNPNMDTWSYGQ